MHLANPNANPAAPIVNKLVDPAALPIALITNAAGVPMPLYFFLNFFGMCGAKLRTFAQSKTHRFFFVLQLPLMLKI
jgi:hypothetical protein